MAKLAHRNRARILDDGSAGPNPALMRALGRAHEWRGWMEQGEVMSYRAIAKRAGVTPSHVQTILPLAFLAPVLTRELLDGRRQLHGHGFQHLALCARGVVLKLVPKLCSAPRVPFQFWAP